MNYALKLREQFRHDLISQRELRAVYWPTSEASIHNGISRSIKSNNLIRLKRGLYLFSKRLRRGSVSKFLVANKMFEPSYISFESALSYHQWIPEGVYTTTSACLPRKKKSFHNELGDFSYDYIPCRDFFLGVYHETKKSGSLIATPIKALFDLIYLRKKNYQRIDELQSDLRIERSDLALEVMQYSAEELETLAGHYHKSNVMRFFQVLITEFK